MTEGAQPGEREGCARKMALLEDVRNAMGDLMAIHDTELAVLLSEDFERLEHVRIRLKAARRLKASLIDLYREHVLSHGC
jgi:hypothetical protein